MERLLASCLLFLPFAAAFVPSYRRGVVGLGPESISYALRAVSMSTALHYPHLHLTEYPDDNFEHTLGYGQADFAPSRLQEISSNCIANVIRNKKPMNAVNDLLDCLVSCNEPIMISIHYS